MLARILEHVTVADPLGDLPDLLTLAQVLDAIPDPRHRRGHRYRLGPLPALSLLAVLSGATFLVKITRFISCMAPNYPTKPVCPARREIRHMKISTVRPNLSFPDAAQAIQVTRRCIDHRTGKTTIMAIYRHHQPPTRPDHPHSTRRPNPRALEHRSPAPHPRRHPP
ncbi:transposase family protein [Nonomuraea fuscirosea]|uniref:transposase family protein n=1 Tax=Nonomuraea fuscirosea TaxID=1291556 RepID=UPI0033D6DF2D